MQHILKRCVQDAASVSGVFSPLSIESDLGISMQHVSHARLADALQCIYNAKTEHMWHAAAALEIAWCLLDGMAASSDTSTRSFTSSQNSAEALIHFCCRHPASIHQRLHSLIPPLISHHKLLSEDARIALCAAFVAWSDHELTSALLHFRALQPEESHMKVLRQAASANRSLLLHIVSHVAALQRRSPRSLYLTAFALSAGAFDSLPTSCRSRASSGGVHTTCNSAIVIPQRMPNLAATFTLQGAKRRELSFDRSGTQNTSENEIGSSSSSSRAGTDKAHALRCSYVESLLLGLNAEISCVRSYIATGGNAFELMPLLNWLLAAEASNAIDGNGRIGLGQLEAMVCAILDQRDRNEMGGSQPPHCSMLHAIVTVAASSTCGREDEKSVRKNALMSNCIGTLMAFCFAPLSRRVLRFASHAIMMTAHV